METTTRIREATTTTPRRGHPLLRRWYAEWCISVDLLVAASVLVLPAAGA
ncbi:hypothetical protein [Nonomuraea recticatena]